MPHWVRQSRLPLRAGALLSTRGNSGVILAQMFRAVADALGTAGDTADPAARVHSGPDQGGPRRLRQRWARPVEGTISRSPSREWHGGAPEPSRPLPT